MNNQHYEKLGRFSIEEIHGKLGPEIDKMLSREQCVGFATIKS